VTAPEVFGIALQLAGFFFGFVVAVVGVFLVLRSVEDR
jgi:uncharacterized membrane protein